MKSRIFIYSLLAMSFALIFTNSCKKDEITNNTNPVITTVTDIDGNVYHTVTIGTQVWMVENLKTTKYRNGDLIPNVTSAAAWSSLTTGAYCNYNNNTDTAMVYGKLYNFYCVTDSRNIAPTGWHVATDSDWHTLVLYLDSTAQLINGSESFSSGAKMKETGTIHWNSPNVGATNSSGFTALPGGDCNYNGVFEKIENLGLWWCSTSYDTNGAWYRSIDTNNPNVGRYTGHKKYGLAVRCIKD